MGILNIIFGRKKRIAKELSIDINKRMEIMADYIGSYREKRKLAEKLKALDTPLNEKMSLLEQMKKLIPEELVDITNEQRTEKEIRRDLKALATNFESERLQSLGHAFSAEYELSGHALRFLKKLYEILQLELHTIELFKKNPRKIDTDSYHLWVLIDRTELMIWRRLNYESYGDEKRKRMIQRAIEIIFIGKPIHTKTRKTVTQKPTAEIKDSAKLIYEEILQYVSSGGDFDGEKLAQIIDTDEELVQWIKDQYPKISREKLARIINAIRYFYDNAKLP